jgi:protein-tyrosine phosphatase
MRRIIFVCLGNICRSPAAEYIFKSVIKSLNLEGEFEVVSRATSYEEVGNDIYPPMKRELLKNQIVLGSHSATRITQKDYDWADYIFYMEETNKRSLDYILTDTRNIIKPIYLFIIHTIHVWTYITTYH